MFRDLVVDVPDALIVWRSGLTSTHSASGRAGRRHDCDSGIRAAQSGHRARATARLMGFCELTRGLRPPLAVAVGWCHRDPCRSYWGWTARSRW